MEVLEQELTKRLEEAGGGWRKQPGASSKYLPDAQVEVLEQELTKRLEKAGGSSQKSSVNIYLMPRWRCWSRS